MKSSPAKFAPSRGLSIPQRGQRDACGLAGLNLGPLDDEVGKSLAFGQLAGFMNSIISPAKKAGWLVLAASYLAIYTIALARDLHQWGGLLQRVAEAVVYGSLDFSSWQALSGRGNST